MGHKGYYGQYTGNSKFSKKHDEAYDAKEAYNKDLTASARLHYLENDRHDHNSPAHQDKKMMVKKKFGDRGMIFLRNGCYFFCRWYPCDSKSNKRHKSAS